MAAIVSMLLFWPLAALIATVLHLLGLPYEPLATFGGRVGFAAGMLLWWLLVFLGAAIYAAVVFPWDEPVHGWPQK